MVDKHKSLWKLDDHQCGTQVNVVTVQSAVEDPMRNGMWTMCTMFLFCPESKFRLA